MNKTFSEIDMFPLLSTMVLGISGESVYYNCYVCSDVHLEELLVISCFDLMFQLLNDK